VQRILPLVRRRTFTYGESAQADLRISGIQAGPAGSGFQLDHRDRGLGSFRLNVPGIHNVLNATAAVAIGLELDIPAGKIREGLETYSGVDRRMQVRGEAAGVTVLDDYGHHPTEIRATLAAARLGGYKRIHVLFQPHRYTRTQLLMDSFAQAFHAADQVYMLDIYAASEPPIPGITAEALARRLRDFGHRGVEYVGSMDAGIESVAAAAQSGDVVVTLGAGNVSQAGERILNSLQERS